jgi:predicted metal-dependent hydrolase
LQAKAEHIEIDGIGQVWFERSKRAKHINISVKPFKGVRVAVPSGVSFKKAKQFAQSKRSWIRKHLDKMKQVEKELDAFTKDSIKIDRRQAGSHLKY